MIAFFKGNTFQIFGAAMGCLIWISVGWNVFRAWYQGRPADGIVVAAATMACIALALQVSSNGLRLVAQLLR